MERARSISKSMLSYIRRTREHKEFLLKETAEFERGKRHLANMMGLKSDEMTQADIDDAIGYLFPSGLFDKRARPIMKHPDLLYKAQKEAQFDISGRPHHYLFYTVLPNYYETLSVIQKELRGLNEYEDEQLAQGELDSTDRYNLSGKRWLTQEELSDQLLEKINDTDYSYFIKCLEHLVNHAYSNRARKFIEKFTQDLPSQSTNLELPELLRNDAGQIYTVMQKRHREHRVQVKTVINGSGIIDIDGSDILFFDAPYVRRGIYFPIRLAGLQDKVDIYANMIMPKKNEKIGQVSVAYCIRSAVSSTIAAYNPEIRDRFRLAGLLTEDLRLKERKKFGQMKARRKYTWKKR